MTLAIVICAIVIGGLVGAGLFACLRAGDRAVARELRSMVT